MTKIFYMPFELWIIAIAVFAFLFSLINKNAEYAIIPSFIAFTVVILIHGRNIDPFFVTGLKFEIRLIAAFFLVSALILQEHFFEVFFGLIKAFLDNAYYSGNILVTSLRRLW